ncbi:MAG: hypothetical protein ACRCY9_12015 [Phycicoccus sp.]
MLLEVWKCAACRGSTHCQEGEPGMKAYDIGGDTPSTDEFADPHAGLSTATPFADAVLRLRRRADQVCAPISFHALPWSGGRSLAGTGPLGAKYQTLFGMDFLATDLTLSGVVLDSFLKPTGPLDDAQVLAASAFGADQTFFVTCGTSLSNQIAIDAVATPGGRLLVDRAAHQSLHAAVARCVSTVDYTPALASAGAPHPPVLDLDGTARQLAAADAAGRPYDAVVLAASSYDGVRYRMDSVLDCCLAASTTSTFVVDEAWSAIDAFHPLQRPATALAVARRLRRNRSDVRVVVTHSAHKSMSAARQGSYLHVLGDPALRERVASALRARHSTSPSIPILASLDLARAHAQMVGHDRLDEAIRLADRLRVEVADNPLLSPYAVAEGLAGVAAYLDHDATTVSLDVRELGLDGADVRRRLFAEHGVYVARASRDRVLVKVHIGVEAADLDRLVVALGSIAQRAGRRTVDPVPASARDWTGERMSDLVVAYPPGVPIALPGELWSAEHQQTLDACRDANVDVYALAVDDRGRAGES